MAVRNALLTLVTNFALHCSVDSGSGRGLVWSCLLVLSPGKKRKKKKKTSHKKKLFRLMVFTL